MHDVKTGLFSKLIGGLALAGALSIAAVDARAEALELQFDRVLGGKPKPARPITAPARITVQPFVPSSAPRAYSNSLEAEVAALADAARGRIGVAAIDLATGRSVSVLGDTPFPMASTSKIAIAATFLDQVDRGRLRLSDRFPLMVPQRSLKFSSPVAPVRPGASLTALELIDRSIIHSDNQATDALLAAVGGPQVVNRWVRDAGIAGFRLDRDIATLVRDDGQFDPARMVDLRDSATPLSMVRLVSGLYQGQWLTPGSRQVLMSAMERCVTGKRRMRALLPADAQVLHKTGTLNNTSSDVGIINTPDGRAIAVAIYVTGQGGKPARDARIASIARVIYDGYQVEASSLRRTASR